jgi:hypothetical protein
MNSLYDSISPSTDSGVAHLGSKVWSNELGKADEYVSFVPTCLRRVPGTCNSERMYGTARATRREAFDWLRAHRPPFESEALGVLHAGRVMPDMLGSPEWPKMLVDAELRDDRSSLRKRWGAWWDVALKYGGTNGSFLQVLVNLGFWFMVAPLALVIVGAWTWLRRLVGGRKRN